MVKNEMSTSGFFIKNDYLPEEQQKIIKNIITDYQIPWYYHKTTAFDENTKNQKPQMCHYLYNDGNICSPHYYDIMNQFYIPEFSTHRLNRIKFNLNFPHHNRKLIKPHLDLVSGRGVSYLYYPITSDGPTFVWHNRWKKQKIHPIQGRIIRIPGNMYHTGNIPYKYERRIVMNIVFEEN